ncbi:MAG: hypothetical protein R3224_06185 [Balneolaceae bacterium]|nr:hypothetical protein [Balneolaceae bacterium]
MRNVRLLILFPAALLLCGPLAEAQAPYRSALSINATGDVHSYSYSYHHSYVLSRKPAYAPGFAGVPDTAETEPKNPSKALGRAIGHTVVPIALGVLIVVNTSPFDDDPLATAGGLLMLHGVLTGPSMGNFYARDWLRGWGGVGARILSFVIIDSDRRNRELRNVLGIGLLAGSALYNIATAPASARAYNRRAGIQYGAGVLQVPGSGAAVPVLTAGIRF